MEDSEHIEQWVFKALLANGLLPIHLPFKWEFSDKTPSGALGWATYSERKISLNTEYWRGLSTERRRQLVMHEACHLISFHLYGVEGKGHRRKWRDCMRNCGLVPDRCEAVQFATKKKPNEGRCNCRSWFFSNIILKRMMCGSNRRCPKCKEQIKVLTS